MALRRKRMNESGGGAVEAAALRSAAGGGCGADETSGGSPCWPITDAGTERSDVRAAASQECQRVRCERGDLGFPRKSVGSPKCQRGVRPSSASPTLRPRAMCDTALLPCQGYESV